MASWRQGVPDEYSFASEVARIRKDQAVCLFDHAHRGTLLDVAGAFKEDREDRFAQSSDNGELAAMRQLGQSITARVFF
jgi:hypothetical protein